MNVNPHIGAAPPTEIVEDSEPETVSRLKILFVVTEDWFFSSHFLPMARAAHNMGLEPVVVCRVRAHAEEIRHAGARVIAINDERRRADPASLAFGVKRLAQIMRLEKPDLVHCIALRSIVVGGIAARLARIERRVLALTGGGFLSIRTDPFARFTRLMTRTLVTSILTGGAVRFLFENRSDPGFFGLAPEDPRVAIVGGAGIDPGSFAASPLPESATLRVAVVSRMLWSKGIDVVVQAVSRAREAGTAVELSLYGAPDPSNPRSIPEAVLRGWSELPGIRWHGPTRNVEEVWRTHHVCCLSSRGGEGLPRSILEAAACKRCIVTTDVPGCRDFVRSGVDGFVVPPEDIDALVSVLQTLENDKHLAGRLGENAHLRLLSGYTEAHVTAVVRRLWQEMLIDVP